MVPVLNRDLRLGTVFDVFYKKPPVKGTYIPYPYGAVDSRFQMRTEPPNTASSYTQTKPFNILSSSDRSLVVGERRSKFSGVVVVLCPCGCSEKEDECK
jgi:hypothetical protein